MNAWQTELEINKEVMLMKKTLTGFLIMAAVILMAGCGQTDNVLAGTQETELLITAERTQKQSGQDAPDNTAAPLGEADKTADSRNNILIAYFSRSGNTEQVAKEIQSQTGGDLFEIVPAEPYPSDYNETADRWHEERDTDARPGITGKVENMDDYNIVFLGYPIWSSDLPAVNRTFLEQYDFSGKTIIPFCTHGGSAFGNSIDKIKELAPGSVMEQGYETHGESASGCADEVGRWLDELGLR